MFLLRHWQQTRVCSSGVSIVLRAPEPNPVSFLNFSRRLGRPFFVGSWIGGARHRSRNIFVNVMSRMTHMTSCFERIAKIMRVECNSTQMEKNTIFLKLISSAAQCCLLHSHLILFKSYGRWTFMPGCTIHFITVHSPKRRQLLNTHSYS